MSSDAAQTLVFIGFALVISLLSVRAFRRNDLTFTLLSLWGLVAGLFVLVPVVSILLRSRAQDAGISPTGVILGFSVAILVSALFRLSTETTRQRVSLHTLVRRFAEVHSGAGEDQHRVESVAPAITVVIPAWNEAQSIFQVVRSCLVVADRCIVVDDGCTDRTASLARTAGATVISHAVNMGVGAALRTGFAAAATTDAEVVVQCDADGQHNTEDIRPLAHALLERRLDMLVGSRFVKDGAYSAKPHLARRIVAGLLARYASRNVAVRVTDPTSGFRALTPDMARVVSNNIGDHYLSDTFELLVRAGRGGYRIGEHPVRMTERQAGRPSVRGGRLLTHTVRTFVVVACHLVPPLPPKTGGDQWDRHGERET